MQKKQTAVEWLEFKLKKNWIYKYICPVSIKSLIEQAKQIEEQKIKYDYLQGASKVFDIIDKSRNSNTIENIDSDKYYNETYGGSE